MKLEDLLKLEDGALLECKGKNFMGEKVNKFVYFERKCLIADKKQYRVGCWIYPIDWFNVPTLAKLNARMREIKEEYENHLKRLRDGYAKTKSALTKKQ